jgi:antibiotic biosynthesis monooxygenase (ABM) superfamily enzyme
MSVAARIQYYDKATKKGYDVAAVFDNDREDMAWKQNISPERAADMEAKYPKMLLSEAAARCERKEGWLSLCWPKASQQPKQPSRDHAGDDSDVPF